MSVERIAIPADRLALGTYRQWEPGWFLLTAGDFASGEYNCMTISWGTYGILWGRPQVHVLVRPQRHTYGFMERYDTFTVTAFGEQHRAALQLCGSVSGREVDKIAETGLTPVAARRVAAPIYAEAELALECRKIYWHDLDPAHFLDPTIADNYACHDYHRCYYGQVVAISGVQEYALR
ncbi:MAG: flavin reductase [Fimbriimonadaceae bacterium]|nr:flavin reductase [Fimbriimonadaceae bacterium]